MKLSHVVNKEWGSKGRKEQEALRGLTHQDAHRAINEELEIIAEARATEEAEAAREAAQWAEFDAQWAAQRADEWLREFYAADHAFADMDDHYAGTAAAYADEYDSY